MTTESNQDSVALRLRFDRLLAERDSLKKQLEEATAIIEQGISVVDELKAELAQLKQPETDLEKKAWQLYSAVMLQHLSRDQEYVDTEWCFETAQDFIDYTHARRKQVAP